jgi:RHS repeat-associated protein
VIARHDAAHGGWQYHHPDALGSTVAVTNAAGSVIERYLYDPFGLPDIRDANGNARTATAIGNPWLFTGQEWRGDVQLANYKARWYQPTLGRFLQNDPVRFDAGDINLYRYCFNDPINHVDPDGMFVQVIILKGLATGIVGAGVDAGLQVTGGLINGQTLRESVQSIDKTQVVTSGALSAVGLGTFGLVKKAVATVKMAKDLQKAKRTATVVEKSGVQELNLSPVTELMRQEATDAAATEVAKSAAAIAGAQAVQQVAKTIGKEEIKEETPNNTDKDEKVPVKK